MPKKTSLEIQLAKKKDLEHVLTLVDKYHAQIGVTQKYGSPQQLVYNLLKKENSLGAIWLLKKGKSFVGYALLTFGYNLAFGGKDATINEFFIEEQHNKPQLALQAFELIQAEVKALSINALHLDYDNKLQNLSDIGKKAHFSARSNFRRMTMQF